MHPLAMEFVGDRTLSKCELRQKDGDAQDIKDSTDIRAVDAPVAAAQAGRVELRP